MRGDAIDVTAVAPTYQCAEMARIARGTGIDRAASAHAMVCRFGWSAFIGLPWPTKSADMRSMDDKIVASATILQLLRVGRFPSIVLASRT